MRKTLFCVLMMILLLCSCAGEEMGMTADECALQMRTKYLASDFCSGSAVVTADYGERVYGFTIDFIWQYEGTTEITVTAPKELEGLHATVEEGKSRLEFQGFSLGTGDLTGEGLTPLEYLPAVMSYIRDGYMAECSFETQEDRETLRVLFREPGSKPQSGVECILWFDSVSFDLLRAELSYNGDLILHSDFILFTLGEKENGERTHQNVG